MTQSVNREFFGLDRFGLVSPPYRGLETIRNQNLPKAITEDETKTASVPSVRAANPAFDVTRSRLVNGLATERGVAEVSEAGLRELFPERGSA